MAETEQRSEAVDDHDADRREVCMQLVDLVGQKIDARHDDFVAVAKRIEVLCQELPVDLAETHALDAVLLAPRLAVLRPDLVVVVDVQDLGQAPLVLERARNDVRELGFARSRFAADRNDNLVGINLVEPSDDLCTGLLVFLCNQQYIAQHLVSSFARS